MSDFFSFGIATQTDMKVCCWFMSVLSIEKWLYPTLSMNYFISCQYSWV